MIRTVVGIMLPWIIPKILYDTFIRSSTMGSPLEFFYQKGSLRLPLIGKMLEWIHTITSEILALRTHIHEIKGQMANILMALKELHTAITLLASHTNEYQSELFELQKRVMDLQEDCIKINMITAGGNNELIMAHSEDDEPFLGSIREMERSSPFLSEKRTI